MPWPAARGRLGGPPLEEFGSLEAYLADYEPVDGPLSPSYNSRADLFIFSARRAYELAAMWDDDEDDGVATQPAAKKVKKI